MILDGRVTVNGETVTALGTKADPAKDAIKVDGRRIKTEITHRYIVLYKPKGYVTTRSDPEQRRTVMDLIGKGDYIYPVGRLDYDSEGLLLMMTDGDLRSEEHTSELQSRLHLVCRLLLDKKKKTTK